jgi:tRNA-binding EMAP/Myf-like protein
VDSAPTRTATRKERKMVAGAAPPKRDELIAAIGKVLFLRLSKEDAQQLFREAGAKPDWKAVQTFTRQMLTSSAAAATLCSHFVAAGAVLNAYLEPEMYIGGMSPCVADIACYCALIPAMQAFDDVHKWALCNVSRWFDHMQSTVESLLPPPELGCDRKVSFNLDMPDPAPTIASLPLLIGAGGAAASATPDVSDPAPAPGGKGGAPKGAAGGAPAAAGGQEDAKKEKKEKKEKPKKEAPPPPPAGSGIDISWADLRVGKILDASKHPDSDKLYVESIDLGEGEPRTVRWSTRRPPHPPRSPALRRTRRTRHMARTSQTHLIATARGHGHSAALPALADLLRHRQLPDAG